MSGLSCLGQRLQGSPGCSRCRIPVLAVAAHDCTVHTDHALFPQSPVDGHLNGSHLSLFRIRVRIFRIFVFQKRDMEAENEQFSLRYLKSQDCSAAGAARTSRPSEAALQYPRSLNECTENCVHETLRKVRNCIRGDNTSCCNNKPLHFRWLKSEIEVHLFLVSAVWGVRDWGAIFPRMTGAPGSLVEAVSFRAWGGSVPGTRSGEGPGRAQPLLKN